MNKVNSLESTTIWDSRKRKVRSNSILGTLLRLLHTRTKRGIPHNLTLGFPIIVGKYAMSFEFEQQCRLIDRQETLFWNLPEMPQWLWHCLIWVFFGSYRDKNVSTTHALGAELGHLSVWSLSILIQGVRECQITEGRLIYAKCLVNMVRWTDCSKSVIRRYVLDVSGSAVWITSCDQILLLSLNVCRVSTP